MERDSDHEPSWRSLILVWPPPMEMPVPVVLCRTARCYVCDLGVLRGLVDDVVYEDGAMYAPLAACLVCCVCALFVAWRRSGCARGGSRGPAVGVASRSDLDLSRAVSGL